MAGAKAKKKKQNGRWTALLAALLIVMICVCTLYVISFYRLKTETEKSNKALADLYRKTQAEEKKETEKAATPTETEAVIMTYPRKPENVNTAFEELVKINPDTVGFLHIPARTVDDIELPVVQRDHTYYLNHDFYGNENKSGTVFMDQVNSIWPQDEHMILYGHNMKNGTMLARITRYKAEEYAKYNPFVYFDTLYEEGTYVVLAAMQLPAEKMLTDGFNIRTFTFGETSFDAFLSAVRKRAYYVTNVGADENDQLLSILTCSYNEDDERFLLITRRLRDGENEEDILKIFGR